MKRLIILLFVFSKAYAQEPTYVPMKSNYLFRGIKMDTLFLPPSYADTSTATSKVNFAGSVVRVGSKLYMRNSALTQWVDLSASGGGATDTTSLSNRINSKADTSALFLKLNRSDSTIYYTKYRSDTSRTNIYAAIGSKMNYSDTLSLSNRINERVKYTDTANMLIPYLRKADTLNLSNRINQRVRYSDTASMLNPYLRKSDTASLSNRINDKIDSLRRVGTQVSFKKNGTWFNAYTDSIGGGQNGRWGNDTALIVLAKVRNVTGTTMTRGTVVMLNGATGDVASVIRANNKYDSTSARTIGIVKDPIAAGDTGWVVTQGQASKLNLGAFTEGDALYLDSLDGGLTKTKPVAPYHGVFVGIVERANNGNGLLYTKPLNGYELGELHDVRITSPINNQVLVYSDTQDIWKNRNVYSVVDTTKLSARIDLRVRYSDTASMLLPYARSINVVKYTDTATMLSGYTRSLTTDTMRTNIYNQLAQEVNIADTANMLVNYQRMTAFPIATFGAGSGAAGDTSAFTTSAIYGSFYNSGGDTIIVTAYTGVVQGASASVTPSIWFNDSLNVTAGATRIVNSPAAVTSTTTGNTVTSLNNTKIPPNNFVWVNTGTVTTKPTYFSLTLIGYRKRP